MNRVWIVPTAIGILALVVAVATVFTNAVPATIAVVGNDHLVLGLSGLAAVLGLVALLGTKSPSTDVALPPPTEPAPPSDRPRLTEAIDDALERPPIDETIVERRQRGRNRHEARMAVRATAARVLAARHGVSRDEAHERIREGTWTDDPRAAAFLGSGVRLPLRLRLHDWAYGVRYQRGLEAAVAAVERLEQDRSGGDEQ